MISQTNQTCGSTVTGTKTTLVDVLKVAERIRNMPKNDQWLLVDPRGHVYQGKCEDVFPVIAAAHPLLKMPVDFKVSTE